MSVVILQYSRTKRIIQIVLLLILIGCIYFFVFARFFSNTPNENNWFSKSFRAGLAKHEFWRSVFNLRRDGDGQSEYLTKKKLVVIIYTTENNAVSAEVKTSLEQEIKNALPNILEVKFIDGQQLYLENSSYMRKEIRELIQNLPRKPIADATAALNVYILNRSEEFPSNVGLTNQENGIVVFWDTIKDLSGQSANNFDAYLVSTILHEFGHQLGLGHVDDQNCIMSQTVEVPIQPVTQNYWVLKNYCQQEKDLIASKFK